MAVVRRVCRLWTRKEKFKELVKALAPLLKGYGYKRQGQTFRIRRDDNWGVVFFRPEKWSTKTELQFTINLGIFSQAIDSFYRGLKPMLSHRD